MENDWGRRYGLQSTTPEAYQWTEDNSQHNHYAPRNIILTSPRAKSSRPLRQIYTIDGGWEPTFEATPPDDNDDKNKKTMTNDQ